MIRLALLAVACIAVAVALACGLEWWLDRDDPWGDPADDEEW